MSPVNTEFHTGLLESPSNGHFVQFYEADDQLLARNVSQYLAEGLRLGEPGLVVAASDHREAFCRELRRLGIKTSEVVDQGLLTLLDAQETLDSFMLDRRPDRFRFQNSVGTLIQNIKQRTGCSTLRVYGEMVGILWRSWQYSAAIELEQFWNELLDDVGFSLYCAYSIDVFGREFQRDSVYALLCDHTHVIPAGVNACIDNALTQALDETLTSGGRDLPEPDKCLRPSAWAEMPDAEAKILWLRSNFPDAADDILARARQLYLASR